MDLNVSTTCSTFLPATLLSVNFQSCIFHPCKFVRHFPVLHFPALHLCPSFSSPAFSTPATLSVIFQSCNFHPLKFLVRHFPALQIQRPRFGVQKTGNCPSLLDSIALSMLRTYRRPARSVLSSALLQSRPTHTHAHSKLHLECYFPLSVARWRFRVIITYLCDYLSNSTRSCKTV